MKTRNIEFNWDSYSSQKHKPCPYY